MKLTILAGFAAVLILTPAVSVHAAINNLDGLTNGTQFLRSNNTDANLSLVISSSSPSTHYFRAVWTGILSPARGGTGAASFADGSIPFFGGGKFSENNTDFFWSDLSKLFHAKNIAFDSATGTSLYATAIYGDTAGLNTLNANSINVTGSSTLPFLYYGSASGNNLYASSASIGLVYAGQWQGSPIADPYISSSGNWNNKGIVNSINGVSRSTVNIFAGTGINVSTSTFGVTISAASSSSAGPGGLNGELQFNNHGIFDGATTLLYSTTTRQFTVSGNSIFATTSIANLSLNMPLSPSSGGTGIGYYQPGDILVAGSSGQLTRLPKGEEGQVLTVDSTSPSGLAWKTISVSTPVNQSFSFTGASTSWTVPPGITSITVTARGAGGNAFNGVCDSQAVASIASGVISVTPGTTYYLNVGGKATNEYGGYNGGGMGASGGSQYPSFGGGGMTWFGTSPTFNQNNVLIIAAGAGGSSQTAEGYCGGPAGYPSGATGGNPGGAGAPGTGGTQSAGGVGGVGSSCTATDGVAGTGGNGCTANNTAGGGGGGGYYGGGGGAVNSNNPGMGGGGSDFFAAGVASTSVSAASSASLDGYLTIVSN